MASVPARWKAGCPGQGGDWPEGETGGVMLRASSWLALCGSFPGGLPCTCSPRRGSPAPFKSKGMTLLTVKSQVKGKEQVLCV